MILLDVPATAATASVSVATVTAEEGVASGGKGGLRGIPDYTAKRGLQLKLLDTCTKCVGLVLAHLVQHFLDTSGGVGVDGSGIHCVLVLALLDQLLGVAAALIAFEARLVDCAGHISEPGTQVALILVSQVQRLVTKLTHSVIGLTLTSLYGVGQTSNSVLQIVEVHAIAQTSLGYRFATSTVSPETVPVEDQGEQNNHQPSAHTETITAVAVISVGCRSNIGQTIVVYFHSVLSK